MIALLLALAQDAAPVEATLTVSPPQARVGDRVEVSLRVAHGGVEAIEWPRLEETLRGVRVRDRREERAEKDGRVTESRILVVSPLAPGATEIPPQVVTFRRAGVEGFQTTAAATIEVAATAGEGESDLRPAKGPIEVPRPAWPWIVAGALAALAAFLLVRRLRRKRPAAGRSAPPLPAHEVALRSLEELAGRSLADDAARKAFYYDLSMTVRRYLEGRFGLRAPRRTTQEFLEEASGFAPLTPEHRWLLRSFLESADLVKYAKHRPGREEIDGALGAARRFVEETRPDLAASPAGAAA